MARDRSTGIFGRRVQGGLRRGLGNRSLLLLALLTSALLAFLLTVDMVSPGPGGSARLSPGDIADHDYKAPADIEVVDEAATGERRQAAGDSAPVVYDWDKEWGGHLRTRVDAAFEAARAATARDSAEGTPETLQLSAFSEALGAPTELPASAAAWLAQRAFSDEDQADLKRVLDPVRSRLIVDDREEFARQAEKRRVIVRELGSEGAESVLEATDAVLASEDARVLVGDEVESALSERPRSERRALFALAGPLIGPNLSFNLRATDERRQAAEDSVKQVAISLRKGEIIVRDGDPITEAHLLILEDVRKQFSVSNRLGEFVGVAGLVFAVLLAMWHFGATGIERFPSRPRDAIFLLSTLVLATLGTKVGLFMADVVASSPEFRSLIERVAQLLALPAVADGESPLYYLIPLAGATMLVRLVQSAETAALFAILAAPLAGLQVGGEISFAVYTLVGSLVAAVGAARVTQRGTLLRAGAAVGLVNVGVIGAIALLGENPLSVGTLLAAGAGFGGGCLAGGIVSALAPVIEGVFGYTTDIKLLELANRERPLLRELEIRAPGTYHHSMMVGHLAEKAAEAIGANALLAKVGGYYHDIGKMRRPHFFVENVTVHQGENRHEKLSPSMSARIIQAHVKDGLELGRQYKLAPGIMQGIGEHHGTSIIRFFYEKAKELVDPDKGELVQEHEYRYPGPKPQTREAGILMLADSVEAASRTLADTSPARIQQLVQRTINNYFRDGQLDDCSLTLRDLHAIARSFIDTLSAIRHERIDYPEPTDAEGRRLDEGVDEGVVERLEPRKKDRPDAAPEKREDDLRRLGLS